ncbi:ester cyclase [Mycobacterium barrassiae]|uniref:ester cyclase n=1 Tax=Mycobacterium barrassiae TaxID=319709 RepID=UPI0022659908|nr:ester cyclase [Mycobacterium barrassiae]MCV7300060.1 ester cyclase [Mycobacterium barrassiae]
MPSAEEARNIAAFKRFHDAVNAHDLEALARTIDDFVLLDAEIRTPLPIDATGPEKLKRVWSMLFAVYPDLHLAVDDLIAAGDKIVVRNTVTGTQLGEFMGTAPTGTSVTYNEIFIFRFIDGHVAETWGVVDVLAQMRQIGLLER